MCERVQHARERARMLCAVRGVSAVRGVHRRRTRTRATRATPATETHSTAGCGPACSGRAGRDRGVDHAMLVLVQILGAVLGPGRTGPYRFLIFFECRSFSDKQPSLGF